MLQERPHFYDRHIVAGTVNKILNRNGFGEGNDTSQGRLFFFILLIFGGFSTRKDHLTHHNIFKYIYFHDITNNIYQKQIKYHVFNARLRIPS